MQAISRMSEKAIWPTTSSLRTRTPPGESARDRSLSEAINGIRPVCSSGAKLQTIPVTMLARNAKMRMR
jgi:hypothetical protein